MNPTRRDLVAALGVSAVRGGATAGLALPPFSLAAQTPAEFPVPDLGNLHELMNWVSAQNEMPLSFLQARWKSLDDWKREVRAVLPRLFNYSPKPAALSAARVKLEERDGLTVEEVRISATASYDIPAWVLRPANLRGRVPGVVAIHAHGGQYVWGHEKNVSHPDEHPALTEVRNRTYGRPYAEFLARRGFVVLVIDGFYFGKRRLRPEDLDPNTAPGSMKESLRNLAQMKANTAEWIRAVDRLCSEYETLTAKTIFSAGATWPGMLLWDDMRSVGYLSSLPEVDSRRIGCVGLSIGGLRTAHLIAADSRIKAACVVGWMTQFHEQLRNHLRHHTWMIYVPGLYSQLDLPDAAALMAPGALLVQQCSRDALYPLAAMKGAVEKLERIYAKAGVAERFRGGFYDVPHSFTPEMQDEAFAWLEKWL